MTNPMKTLTQPPKTLHVTAQKDKRYVLYFDHDKKEYVFEEKGIRN
jgi:hypothetical protein